MKTFTHKIANIYFAYAPELEVSVFGDCRDEALNNLTDEIRQRQGAAEATGKERE